MKIAIIGPGIMPIPPTGWGAVEILIHDIRCVLEELGHTVHVVNVQDKNEIIRQTNNLDVDFVHVQYDEHIDVVPYLKHKHIAITSHYGYFEQPNKWDEGYKRIASNFLTTNVDIFALSPSIANLYKSLAKANVSKVHPRYSDSRVHVVHNGVRDDLFRFSKECKFSNKSIYLAKIDYRKRQYIFQDIPNLYFAGNIADNRFNPDSNQYLGEWSKEHLYQNLTDYANLALLSDGEAHPLVCVEALSAGLGLVLSEFACANLDLSLPFIDIIPESQIKNIPYVQKVLRENASKSVSMRKKIKEYGSSFSWKNVVSNYYIPAVKRVVSNS
jgi:hypothetical protein